MSPSTLPLLRALARSRSRLPLGLPSRTLLPRCIPKRTHRLLTTLPENPSDDPTSPFQTRPPPPQNYQSPFLPPPHTPSEQDSVVRETRRIYGLTFAALATMCAIYLVATGAPRGDKADALPPPVERGVESLLAEQRPGGTVDSGTSKIPGFPRRVWIPRHVLTDSDLAHGGGGKVVGTGLAPPDVPTPPTTQRTKVTLKPAPGEPAAEVDEYVLLGHGIRTVSFLRVQVYVVGLYIHVEDLPLLGKRLGALSTLSPPPGPGASPPSPPPSPSPANAAPAPRDFYAQTLTTAPVRTALRIVPVRNTDWGHMRDGFVRAILANQTPPGSAPSDDRFAAELGRFKALFAPAPTVPRAVPSGVPIYLLRGKEGELRVLYDAAGKGGLVGLGGGEKEKEGETQGQGVVRDGRVTGALWEGYIGAGKVASEEMRGRVWERLEAVRRGGRVDGDGGVGGERLDERGGRGGVVRAAGGV